MPLLNAAALQTMEQNKWNLISLFLQSHTTLKSSVAFSEHSDFVLQLHAISSVSLVGLVSLSLYHCLLASCSEQRLSKADLYSLSYFNFRGLYSPLT